MVSHLKSTLMTNSFHCIVHFISSRFYWTISLPWCLFSWTITYNVGPTCIMHGSGVLDDAREGAMADIPAEGTSGKGTASRDRWGRWGKVMTSPGCVFSFTQVYKCTI